MSSALLKHALNLQGDVSLFEHWVHPGKNDLLAKEEAGLLQMYIDYCAKQINTFLAAARAELPNERWTADKKVPGRLLTTTTVNRLIICLGRVTEAGKLGGFDDYRDRLSGLGEFQFEVYKSSQYGKTGQDLYDRYFG